MFSEPKQHSLILTAVEFLFLLLSVPSRTDMVASAVAHICCAVLCGSPLPDGPISEEESIAIIRTIEVN